MYLDSSQIAKKKGVPGPGSYMDQTALSPLGNYSISEYVNSRAARINTGRRFQTHHKMVPGPGTYEEVGRVAQGHQTISSFKSVLTKNLNTSAEKCPGKSSRFESPGPGTYRPPSDFGYTDFI